MRARLFRILFALIFITACQSAQKRTVEIAVPPAVLEKLTPPPQAPAAPAPAVVLDHKYFQVHYSPEFKLAKYVKYTLTADRLRSRAAARKNRFFSDPLLKLKKLPAVAQNAFAKSGYQRGHLAPAEDFRFSQEAIDATFVMSNMAPQKQNLNAGPWKKLEELVRRFACGEEKVTVITGPVLEASLDRLPSGVTVPERFFKIVIDETPPRKAIAYILHQNDRGNVLRERIASFDEIKKSTQEDFYAEIAAEERRNPAQINAWKEADCR